MKKRMNLGVTILYGVMAVLILFAGNAKANGMPQLVATRTLELPDDIKPGSTIKVQIKLKVEKAAAAKLVLTETVPLGWSVISAEESGLKYNRPDLEWTWEAVKDGTKKAVAYELKIPEDAGAQNYSIDGELSAFENSTEITRTNVIGHDSITIESTSRSRWVAGVAMIIVLIAFGLIFWLSWRNDKNLDKGEMRRAIAGTLIVGFSVLTFLCIYYRIFQTEVILAYIEMVGIVIGFYFGSRTAAQKRAEAAAMITIEHVRFDNTKTFITLRNAGDSEIKVDKFYINDHPFEKAVLISSKTSEEIEIDLDAQYQAGTEYRIKVATSNGFTAESSAKAPP